MVLQNLYNIMVSTRTFYKVPIVIDSIVSIQITKNENIRLIQVFHKDIMYIQAFY